MYLSPLMLFGINCSSKLRLLKPHATKVYVD